MEKILLCALMTLMLAGCVKDKPAPKTNGDADAVVGLKVPSSFDWKTTSDIECDFSAAHSSKVRLATADGAKPLAEFMVGADAAPVALSLPHALDKLCVSYETAIGTWKSTTMPVSKMLSFSVPADSRNYEETRAPGNASGSVGEIVYPNENEWGTLLYEDLWPGYGDYDFNDLVVNYSMRLAMQNKNKVERMIVSLRVKAVGGSLPYDFYLRLNDVQAPNGKTYRVKGGEIDVIEVLSSENASEEVVVTALNSEEYVKDPAVIEVRGLRNNVNKPVGAAYVNTEEGYEMSPDEYVTVEFLVYFRNSIATEAVTLGAFDFFIARANDAGERIEIHMGDCDATIDGMDYYNRAIGNSKMAKLYYSTDRLVWALNVPADIQHAYEKVDFLKAYPKMAEWAQSGGTRSQDWYRHGDPQYLVHKK